MVKNRNTNDVIFYFLCEAYIKLQFEPYTLAKSKNILNLAPNALMFLFMLFARSARSENTNPTMNFSPPPLELCDAFAFVIVVSARRLD
jgi:hypothetical protein